MTRNVRTFPSDFMRHIATACALPLLFLSGCGEPTAQYSTNRVYLRLQEEQSGAAYAQEQLQAVTNVMEAMFGTPDLPALPGGAEGTEDVLDLARVRAAAGPVHSYNYGDGAGLYRQHCVHCHGITGNGRGPTAEFLNPYPRDFTRGTFKFKSPPIGIKPTEEDLRHILMNGIAGTAMPSFALLSEGEVESLVDYVKFLTIRGETERRLIEAMGSGDFYDSEHPSENETLLAEFAGREFLVDEVLSEGIASWN